MDEQLAAALQALFAANIGLSVDLYGMLCIYQLENGNCSIYTNIVSVNHPELSCNADDLPVEEAVKLFIEKRHELKLGYDHEKGAKK